MSKIITYTVKLRHITDNKTKTVTVRASKQAIQGTVYEQYPGWDIVSYHSQGE